MSRPNAHDSGINLVAVRKTYLRGKKVALDNLSASFEASRATGLLGPNGCGKSTLSKLISGASKPDSGSIYVDGRNPTAGDLKDRLSVSVMHQKPTFEMMLTPLDNLRIGACQRGLRWGRVRNSVYELLERLDFDHSLLSQMTWTLSGGEFKRLQFARCLLSPPKYFLLDEPTAGLDIDGRERFWSLLHELRSTHGMSLIWTTHNVSEIEDNCDDLLIMDAGSCLYNGDVWEFIHNQDFNSLALRFAEVPSDSVLNTASDFYGVRFRRHGNCLLSESKWDAEAPSIDHSRSYIDGLRDIYIERPSLEKAYSNFTRDLSSRSAA